MICTWSEQDLEGYLSFPSGHSAASFVLATFMCAYLRWTLYARASANLLRGPGKNVRHCMRRFLCDHYVPGLAVDDHSTGGRIGHVGGPDPLLAGLLRRREVLRFLHRISAAQQTRCSRLVDHRHGPADVVAGAMVGGIVGILYAARAIASFAPPEQLLS